MKSVVFFLYKALDGYFAGLFPSIPYSIYLPDLMLPNGFFFSFGVEILDEGGVAMTWGGLTEFVARP